MALEHERELEQAVGAEQSRCQIDLKSEINQLKQHHLDQLEEQRLQLQAEFDDEIARVE